MKTMIMRRAFLLSPYIFTVELRTDLCDMTQLSHNHLSQFSQHCIMIPSSCYRQWSVCLCESFSDKGITVREDNICLHIALIITIMILSILSTMPVEEKDYQVL